MARCRLTAAALASAAVLLAACGREDEVGGQAQPGDVAAHAGLCAAEDAAAGGDAGEADRVFFSRAHDQLHDVAARLDDVDRPAAARLLEAKAAVEAALADEESTSASELASELGRLVDATASAIERLSGDAPSGCE